MPQFSFEEEEQPLATEAPLFSFEQPEEVTPEDNSLFSFEQPGYAPPVKATEDTTDTERDWLDVGSDLGVSFASGANALFKTAGDIYGLTTGDLKNYASEQGARGVKFWNDLKTPELKSMEATRKEKIDAAEGDLTKAGVAFWETISSPSLLTSFIFEQAPMFVPIMGAGRAAGAVALARGASEKVAGKYATGVAIGAGAAMQGADAGSQAYQQLMDIPEAVWKQNSSYDGTNKEELAMSLARNATIASALISVGSNMLPGARYLEKALVGVKLPGANRAGNMLVGGFGEAFSEAIEESGGAISANVATKQIDPTQEIMEGAGEQAGLAATAGLFGAAGGAVVTTEETTEPDNELFDGLQNLQDTAEQNVADQGGDRLEQVTAAAKILSETEARDPRVRVKRGLDAEGNIVFEERQTQAEFEAALEKDKANADEIKKDKAAKAKAAEEEAVAKTLTTKDATELDEKLAEGIREEDQAKAAKRKEKTPAFEAAEEAAAKQKEAESRDAEILKGYQNAVLAEEEAKKKGPPNQAMKLAFDKAANEAATSEQNATPEPTEAQIEAGNYKKGHVQMQGLDITIENPKGSVREGVNEQGKPWSQKLKNHYGYLKRTEGADNEQIDVFVGPDLNSDKVFIVDQIDQQSGQFDEHKVVLGYKTAATAKLAYKRNFEKGWKAGPITEMTMDEFKTWMKQANTKLPVNDSVELKSTQDQLEMPFQTPVEEKGQLEMDLVEPAAERRRKFGKKYEERMESAKQVIFKKRKGGGIIARAIHGTFRNSLPKRILGSFGGFHAGTATAAKQRLEDTRGSRHQGRPGGEKFFEVDIELKKPFGTPKNPISENDLFSMLNLKNWTKPGNNKAGIKSIDLLKKEGYDGVIYENSVEDRGNTSIMAFDMKSVSEVKPSFVKDSRITRARIGGEVQDQKKLYQENIADVQRGAPEQAMLRVQKVMGGGVISPVVEHTGDLTHRMTESATYDTGGYEFVKEKVDRLIRALDYPYGFVREMNENITSNSTYDSKTRKKLTGREADKAELTFRDKLNKQLQAYADEHKKIPVYNEVQQLARDAAIDVGEKRFRDASAKLHKLQDYLNEGVESWTKRAHETGTANAGARTGDEAQEWQRAKDKGLKLDKKSRMKRAREMGFDTNQVWYHGTFETDEYGGPIERFLGSKDKADTRFMSDLGAWFSASTEVADHFANRGGDYEYAQPQVYPTLLKLQNPAMFDTYEELEKAVNGKDMTAPQFAEYLKEQGYDGIIIEDSFTDIPVSRKDAVVFNPNQIRSVNAAFDPEFKASGDLLARTGQAAQTKVNKAQAQEAIAPLQKLMPALGGNVVTIHESIADAPVALVEDFIEKGIQPKAIFDNGKIHIFAQEHENVADVIESFLHEGVAHVGLRKVFPDLKSILADIYNNVKNSDAMASVIEDYKLDTNLVEDQLVAADEYVARLAEEGLDSPILQRVIDFIRKQLRKIGRVKGWSDNDIRALIRETSLALRGKPLSDITVTTEARVAETGEIVQVKEQADAAVRQLDKRMRVIDKVKDCL